MTLVTWTWSLVSSSGSLRSVANAPGCHHLARLTEVRPARPFHSVSRGRQELLDLDVSQGLGQGRGKPGVAAWAEAAPPHLRPAGGQA